MSADEHVIAVVAEGLVIAAAANDYIIAFAILHDISQAWANSKTVADETVEEFLDVTVADGNSDTLTGETSRIAAHLDPPRCIDGENISVNKISIYIILICQTIWVE